MKFALSKASDAKFDGSIELTTLKDLIKLIDKEGDLIIGRDTYGIYGPKDGFKIIIYDDYVE